MSTTRHCILHSLVLLLLTLTAGTIALVSCSTKIDVPGAPGLDPGKKQVDFAVQVTRDGEVIPDAAITRSDAGSYHAEGSDKIATMNKDIPFGLIGIDMESGTLLIDNESVSSRNGQYTGFFDGGLWTIPVTLTLSAYYPHVGDVAYGDELETYSIHFSQADTDAGPLVSKTVQCAIDQMNMVSIEFQHITNDIGYKVCDVTPTPELQGLIHLRKLTAYNVASAGVFVNDMSMSTGLWHRQGYYRDVVVFEGDAVVGVGSANEKFVGSSTLVDRMVNSHRYYSVPDEILMGKQYVEAIFDVDSFTVEGYEYPPLYNQVSRYSLYGLLPNNIFEYGRQYTFHIGLDLSPIYPAICFTANVADWETKIYENNDEF